MIPRELSDHARQMATWFPIVSVMGPRQSGKSTLLRNAFPDYTYLNLETSKLSNLANNDPAGFMELQPKHSFIDEMQFAPDLFPEMQAISDERHETGQYLISGSQNFLMNKNITESLAGRVGILTLLPLSYRETQGAYPDFSVDQFMFRGGYPRIYDAGIPEDVYFRSYIDTYLQRDISTLLPVRNLTTFQNFLKLCAQNSGELLNASKLARDMELRRETINEWLTVLAASYIVFLLPPYFSNARKRLTKTPKLYFYDTGLLCYLLGIRSVDALIRHPKRGAVFENLIVEETLKRGFNANSESRLYFYRDSNGVEVDLMDMTDSLKPQLIEIKSGITPKDDFFRHLKTVGRDLDIPIEQRQVVYRGKSSYRTPNGRFMSAKDYLLR
ncbi:ATP-binding protein [Bifidobacterium sp. ESL0763]|uniref:ATP-binding protein n=1 Tax=Bifidobacterium sp. ESL0763 TaxID=2983227 RepID=UPI0023F76A41|nr:ATP-binding protein [Bifidobacterium sp. ESL0763]MDF7663217.1 ATP-binding protein [Bifidobacterium sp. ESL0763]